MTTKKLTKEELRKKVADQKFKEVADRIRKENSEAEFHHLQMQRVSWLPIS